MMSEIVEYLAWKAERERTRSARVAQARHGRSLTTWRLRFLRQMLSPTFLRMKRPGSSSISLSSTCSRRAEPPPDDLLRWYRGRAGAGSVMTSSADTAEVRKQELVEGVGGTLAVSVEGRWDSKEESLLSEDETEREGVERLEAIEEAAREHTNVS